VRAVVIPAAIILAIALFNAAFGVAAAEYIPSEIANRFASAVKEIIIEVVNFITPIVDMVAMGMILMGVILIALRQEFYGIRLIVAGGIALIVMHVIVPVLLSFL